MTGTHLRSTAFLIMAGLALCGCGVTLDAEPQALQPGLAPTFAGPGPVTSGPPAPVLPSSPPASPTPEPQTARAWFVLGDGLAPTDVAVEPGAGPAELLEVLAESPVGDALEPGLRTVAVDPVSGDPLATVPPPVEGGEDAVSTTVVVQLRQAFNSLPSTEQVLLLGQIVLTLTGAGSTNVAFVDEGGAPLAVPLPDGRLLEWPAAARDYSSLITAVS